MTLDLRSLPAQLLPRAMQDAASRQLLVWACVLAGVLLLAAAWIWSPLAELLDPRAMGHWLARFRGEPWAPLLLLLVFVVGGLLMLPVTLMVVFAMIAFGSWLGFAYALLASTISAALHFVIGRWLGHRHVERLAGGPVHRLSRRIGRHGLLTVVLLRLMPGAHFTVISLAAGTSHIRFGPFVAGTLFGMAPGMGLLILFLDRLAAAAREPEPLPIAICVGLAVVLMLLLLGVRRWLHRRRRDSPPPV